MPLAAMCYHATHHTHHTGDQTPPLVVNLVASFDLQTGELYTRIPDGRAH